MGLKSAGFSQARRVSVFSKREECELCVRVWDLDELGQIDDWMALKTASESATEFSKSRIQHHGTVVVLERLDGTLNIYDSDQSLDDLQKTISSVVIELEEHLSKVFGRFMSKSDRVRISINGTEIEPWSPFVEHSATQLLPTEDIRVGGVAISCRSYVIPHPEMLKEIDSADRESYRRQLFNSQGFYMYRKDRLICGGVWIDTRHHKELETSLARIEMDIPVELDRNWELTVDKTKFRPPRTVRDDLSRLAELVRGKSRNVYRSRGTSRPSSQVGRRNLVPLLEIGTRRGKSYTRLNEKHPLVLQLLEKPDTKLVRAFIGIFNEAVTQMVSRSSHTDSASSVSLQIPDEVRVCAELLYERLASQQNLKRYEIRDLLLSIEPFIHYPSVIDDLLGDQDE